MFICEPTAAAETTTQADGAPTDPETVAVRWATGICERLRRRLAKPAQDPPLEVDLDLRPEGRSGPTVRTLDSYLTYYERWGETWEIQALLRASWVAGDRDVGLRFLHGVDPFRYPEGGVSAAMVQQVRRMKARIDSERLPRGADKRTHMKLGSGGLTDIEWTVQLLTFQHAHEIPELHNTSTLESLNALEDSGVISPRRYRGP